MEREDSNEKTDRRKDRRLDFVNVSGVFDADKLRVLYINLATLFVFKLVGEIISV